MRIWSLDPKYLDSKGLVAVWRETLLAKKVLENKTEGYKNHPQLIRFKKHSYPLKIINQYLLNIFNEAKKRNYRFDKNKIEKTKKPLKKIKVNSKQLSYEFEHLKKKISNRDPQLYKKINKISNKNIEANPIFEIIEGEIEEWERINF